MQSTLLVPENVCMQIVDVQESLMAKIHNADQVTENVGLLIECCRILGVRMIANTQYRKGLGLYVPELEKLVDDIPRYDKTEFNSLANPETASFFRKLPARVDTVVLVGVETHICIYQSAMGLLDAGYRVWVVSDAVSSRNVEDHVSGLARLEAKGADIGPVEMLVYELLGKAGTPEFKKILPHIINRT